MKPLAEQHRIMEKTVAALERSHRMTKAKRREFELLTFRTLKRSLQLHKPKDTGQMELIPHVHP